MPLHPCRSRRPARSPSNADEAARSARVITTIDPDRAGDVVVPTGLQNVDEYPAEPGRALGAQPLAVPADRRVRVARRAAAARSSPRRGSPAGVPFAEDVFRLYEQGVLRGWSIGFVPRKADARAARATASGLRVEEWDLLEYSAVPIPENPGAVTVAIEKGLVRDPTLRDWLRASRDDRGRRAGGADRRADELRRSRRADDFERDARDSLSFRVPMSPIPCFPREVFPCPQPLPTDKFQSRDELVHVHRAADRDGGREGDARRAARAVGDGRAGRPRLGRVLRAEGRGVRARLRRPRPGQGGDPRAPAAPRPLRRLRLHAAPRAAVVPRAAGDGAPAGVRAAGPPAARRAAPEDDRARRQVRPGRGRLDRAAELGFRTEGARHARSTPPAARSCRCRCSAN